MKELDKIDFRILKILQQNARIPMTELAEKVGLSSTPVTERVCRLSGTLYFRLSRPSQSPSVGQTAIGFVELKLQSKSGNIFEDFKRSAENSANYGVPSGVGRIRLPD